MKTVGSHRNVQMLLLMTSNSVGIFLCYRLALPFLAAFTWALALALVLGPIILTVTAELLVIWRIRAAAEDEETERVAAAALHEAG